MAEPKRSQAPGVDLEHGQISFDLIKSNSFRVIQVDGVFGGQGPRKTFQMALFNERWPIPTRMKHTLTPDGKLGEELPLERRQREAVVREVEVELVMDLSTAKRIAEWMLQMIKALEVADRGNEQAGQHGEDQKT